MILRINNWTKLAIVLSLVVTVFSINAMAQDKAMSPQALKGLIKELKEVVSNNAPNQNDVTLINAKWDKRSDLKGKSKSVVINLLWADVKTVIKDSGVQYQIYSIFAFTKQIPDENFAKSGANQTNSSNKEVENLVDLVFMQHPYVNIEQELEKFPTTKDVKAAQAEDRKNRIEGFEEALKVNKKLTSAQKKFVRANYDKLIKITDKITEDAINLNFRTKQWIQEGLEVTFAKQFNAKEVKDLTAFFDSDKGRQVLNYIRQTEMAELITGNGGKPDFTESDKAEYETFTATPLGKKFITAYLKETIAFEQEQENKARAIPNSDGFAIYEPANLNKLFNKFVAENYKK